MARRRTRLVAGFAALIGLTGTLVFAGALAANADDGLEISTVEMVWTGGALQINGNAALDNTSSVEVLYGSVGTPIGGMTVLCAGVAPNGAGDFVCPTGPLAAGNFDFAARQLGPPADRIDIRTIAIRPPMPNVATPEPSYVTEGSTVTYGGTTSAPNVVVTVTVPGIGSCGIGPYPTAGTAWSCDVTGGTTADVGSYGVGIHQTSGGVDGFDVTRTLEITAAPLLIASPATGSSIVWTGSPTLISGTGTPGIGPVDVYLGGAPLCTDPAPAGDGSWSCTPATAFDTGTFTIRAEQYLDFYESTFDVQVPNPEVDFADPYYAPYSTTTPFSGTTPYVGGAGTLARVDSFDLAWGCSGTPTGPTGAWSCDPFDTDLTDFAIQPGVEYEFTYSMQDPGKPMTPAATFTFVMGQAPPGAPVIDSPMESDVLYQGTGNWMTVSGRATYGSVVDLLDGGDPVVECQGLVVDYNAQWTCSFDESVGTHIYSAVQGAQESDTVIMYVEPNPGGAIAPTVACSFGPGGAFSASSAQNLDDLDIYPMREVEVSTGGSSLDEQGYCNGSAGTTFGPFTEFVFDSPIECAGTCNPAVVSAATLPPGDYEVSQKVSDADGTPGVSFEPHSYVFTIPQAPTITQAVSTTNSVVLRGTATPSDTVRIARSNGGTLCTTTATGSGTWACQFPKTSAASARALSINPPSGGMSAYSASRSIPVFVPTAEITPEAPLTLVNWFLEFGGNLMDLKPGDTFTLNVSGMPEGTKIEVWMHSTPRLIGTATGTGLPMALDLTVPADIESGPHEIKMIGVTPLGTQYFFTSDAMVSGGTLPGDKVEEKPDGESTDAGGAGDRSNPATPSALSDGLAPLSAIAANPATIAIAGGLALALLFLVALPTELLNSSLSSNTSRLGRVYGTVDGALTKAQDWFVKVTRSRALGAVILTTLVAIIYGFVDPNFGFDIVSLRLVLSLAIALFMLTFVASWISGMIIRRAWGAMGVVAMQPSIILFALVGVIVARVLDFSPGFLVGVAIGLELLAASKTVTAKAVFVQLGVVTGLSLAAWVVYSLFTPGNDFFGMLAEDTMVAVTAEGLTGALIAVFPLKFLDGRELWEVSKRLWVAAFLIVATAFALLVLPTAIEGTDVADVGIWLAVFAVFGLISLAVWLVFARAAKREEAAQAQKVDA